MAKKNVTFVMTEEIDREIEVRAFLESRKKSEIVIEALEEFFKKHPRERLPQEKDLPPTLRS